MTRRRLPFKPLDLAAALLAAALVVLAAVWAYSDRGGERRIVIQGKSGEWVYPLDSSGRVEVPGPLGVTVVEFQGGRVHVASSPCPNQTCVASGTIDRPGSYLACLPNQVFVSIQGGAADEALDAVGY